MRKIIACLLLAISTVIGFMIGAEMIPSSIGTIACILIGSSFSICIRELN